LISLEEVKQRAESDAKMHGYYLNPDSGFFNDLLEGLKQNEERYGYPSCPCRLATGKFELDRDIICPCDYRDPDVEEYGYCYCALYISKDVYEGRKVITSIPERRPKEKQRSTYEDSKAIVQDVTIKPIASTSEMLNKRKIWYCKQCGYMCFREEPPYVCPICKAKNEFFSELKIFTDIHE